MAKGLEVMGGLQKLYEVVRNEFSIVFVFRQVLDSPMLALALLLAPVGIYFPCNFRDLLAGGGIEKGLWSIHFGLSRGFGHGLLVRLHLLVQFIVLVVVEFNLSLNLFSGRCQYSSIDPFQVYFINALLLVKVDLPGHCQYMRIDVIDVGLPLLHQGGVLGLPGITGCPIVKSSMGNYALNEELEFLRRQLGLAFLKHFSEESVLLFLASLVGFLVRLLLPVMFHFDKMAILFEMPQVKIVRDSRLKLIIFIAEAT